MKKQRNTRQFYSIFLLLSLTVLVFYLGYLYGIRENSSETVQNFTIQNPNNFRFNSLSEIQEREVLGTSDSQTEAIFGQVFFVINNQNQTEIRVILENIPAKVTQSQGTRSVAIPNSLELKLAKRVQDTTGNENYEYVDLDPENPTILNFNEPNDKGLRSSDFSTIIPYSIYEIEKGLIYERLVFFAENQNPANIYIDTDPDLPVLVRGNQDLGIPGRPAPFFWVRI